MNKTDNYQLNQWEKTDRIMMEDFNRDNAKIEAAIQAEAAARTAAEAALRTLVAEKPAAEKLFSLTTSAQAQMVELDLSGLDLSQYFLISLNFKVSGNINYQIFFNNMERQSSYFTGDVSSGMGCSAYAKDGQPINMLLTPFKNPDYLVETFFRINASTSLGMGNHSALTWGGVNKLIWKSLHYNNPVTYIGAGSKLTIWGVK